MTALIGSDGRTVVVQPSGTSPLDTTPPPGVGLLAPVPGSRGLPGPEGEGEQGPAGRGVADVAVTAGDLDFLMTDGSHETVEVPALDAAAASASAANASAIAAAASAEEAGEAVASGVPNATPTIKGGIRLAGDLGGTWDAPTVELSPNDLNRATGQGFNSTAEPAYYKLADLPVDDGANYASVAVSGRIGGWLTTDTAQWSIVLGNRSPSYSGTEAAAAVLGIGSVESAQNVADLVLFGHPDKSATLYLRAKAGQYWAWDVSVLAVQAVVADYTGTTTVPAGSVIWSLTAAEKLDVGPGGVAQLQQVLLDAAPTDPDHAASKGFVDDALAGKANTTHQHTASDIPGSGGVAGPTTFLRGDNQWIVPTNTTYSALTLAEFTAAAATTVRGVSAQLLNQELNQKITGASGTAPSVIGQNLAKAADASAARALLSAVTAADISAAISAVVAGSPVTLDTLDEIAAALGDDPNFATTITNLVGTKAPLIAPALTGAATLDGVSLVKTNDSRLVNERTPIDGSVTSAKIADGSITNLDIAAAAGIVATKLAAAVQASLALADTAVQPGALAAAQLIAVRTASGTTDTLVAADQSQAVELTNAAAVTVTIPTNATVAFAVNSVIEIRQIGAGQVTVVGAGGVALNPPVAIKTRAQWSVMTLVKRGTDSWLAAGDLA